jgi:polyhydroxyalkanoate synthesis regulator phasin
MMQELVKELVEKAGLTEESAEKSIDVMIAFLKSKVPANMQDKVEEIIKTGKFDMMSLMSAFMSSGGGSSSPLDMLKGMFGK